MAIISTPGSGVALLSVLPSTDTLAPQVTLHPTMLAAPSSAKPPTELQSRSERNFQPDGSDDHVVLQGAAYQPLPFLEVRRDLRPRGLGPAVETTRTPTRAGCEAYLRRSAAPSIHSISDTASAVVLQDRSGFLAERFPLRGVSPRLIAHITTLGASRRTLRRSAFGREGPCRLRAFRPAAYDRRRLAAGGRFTDEGGHRSCGFAPD